MLKIGLIDSGIGEFSVLKGLIDGGVNAEYYCLFDNKYHPYGQKTQSELVAIGYSGMQQLIDLGVDIVIIACNTLTSTACRVLRTMFDIPIIGVEPPIKPAAAFCNNILLLATPSTLKSVRVCDMMHKYTDKNFYFPDMARLAPLIEENFDKKQIISRFLEDNLKNYTKVDGIVLGCTHYNFVQEEIKNILPDAQIFSNIDGVVRRTKYILAKNNIVDPILHTIKVITTGETMEVEKRFFLCGYLDEQIEFL